ncbi:MAG: hypothetical protein JWQ77_4048 [Jatrophihabitans sp.]|nr:hypothetical protein [Jatrophihabitans sp.]
MSRPGGNVVPFRQPPKRLTRLRPAEAHELARRARARGHAPASARELLALLLRLANPTSRKPLRRRHTWVGVELGVSESTVIRAVHAIEESGLVVVRRGTGHISTLYAIDPLQVLVLLDELPGSPWLTTPILLGESRALLGCHFATPGVSERQPRAAKLTPPNACARESSLDSPFFPPTPTSAVEDSPAGEHLPPVFDQGPPSSNVKCEHGRTPAQGGCRHCGTTRRQLDAVAAAADKAAADEMRRREVLERNAARAKPEPKEPGSLRAAYRAAKDDTTEPEVTP